MEESNPVIYILLPVHNRKEITVQFVEHLLRQTYIYYQLILIDDGSMDGTADAVKTLIPDVTILKGKGKWWWGGSLNRGYFWLKRRVSDRKDSIVLIINDDTEINPDFLEIGKNILSENSKSLLLAQAYIKGSSKLWDYGVHYDFKENKISTLPKVSEINCFSTRGLFLYLKDFFEIGGFYPILLPHYGSDYEFTMRASRKGFHLITDSKLFLRFSVETSGVHILIPDSMRIKDFLRIYFSKRYVANPIYLTSYFLLAFPFPWNIKHAFFTLMNAAILLLTLVKKDILYALGERTSK